MARTFTLKSNAFEGRYMELVCEQVSVDLASNKSTIRWTLYSKGGNVHYYSTGPTAIYINRTNVYYKDRVNYTAEVFPAATGYVSGTIEVTHDEYGNCSVPVGMQTVIYYGASSSKVYQDSWKLDPISRYATIVSAPYEFTDNDLPTVTYNNPRGNDVDDLEICITDPSASFVVVPYRDIGKTETSYTFKDEDIKTLRQLSAGSTVFGGVFLIRTDIDGKSYHNGSNFTFNVTENEDTIPKVTMTISADNSSIPSSLQSSLAGKYVQGKTKVKATISAEGKYGASITSYSVNLNGVETTSPDAVITTANAIPSSGNVPIIGSAVDTRGFTGHVTNTIESVLPYSKPTVEPYGSESAIRCYRCDANSETKKGNSQWVRIKARFDHKLKDYNNKCSLEWRRKLSSEEWGAQDWTPLVSSESGADGYNGILSTEFALNESYSVQIRAVDSFEEFTIEDFEIPTQAVALHLGADGTKVTVGDYCDDNDDPYTFRSAWRAKFDNGIHTNHIESIDKYDSKDFNTLYLHTGYYIGESRPNAVGCKNYPINETGILEVISAMRVNETTGNPWGFAYQTYRDYTGAIYTRCYYSSVGWTEWKKII